MEDGNQNKPCYSISGSIISIYQNGVKERAPVKVLRQMQFHLSNFLDDKLTNEDWWLAEHTVLRERALINRGTGLDSDEDDMTANEIQHCRNELSELLTLKELNISAFALQLEHLQGLKAFKSID